MARSVLPVRILEVREEADTVFLTQKLRDFREEESYDTGKGDTLDLVTQILDLKLENGSISWVFSKDFVGRRFYRREAAEAPLTEEAPFRIKPFSGRTFMIVLAPSVARGVKKLLTGTVANTLSRVLFIVTGAIVESRIPHETLKELHESSPDCFRCVDCQGL